MRRVKLGLVAVAVTAIAIGGGTYAVGEFTSSAASEGDGPSGLAPRDTTSTPSPPVGETDLPTAPAASPTTKANSPATSPPPPPTPTAMLLRGDQGRDVRELQSRLQQIAWYYGDVTGEYRQPTVHAVSGFQGKRGLPATGQVDGRTWRRLLQMTRLPTYNEMHNILVPGPTILGPADTGDEVRELQARLAQIGWFAEAVTDYYGDVTAAAVTGFQAKRGIPQTGEVDQRTWDRLLEMTREPSSTELHPERAPAPTEGGEHGLDPRCLTGRVLCIDKSMNSLSWVIDGAVQSTVDVRFGSETTPTREGEFSVYFKSRDHVSSLFDTSMPYAMFFSGGQAVHYSPDFAANGYSGASHGCVNVRDLGAIQLMFDQVQVGDDVIVYWS